VAEEVEELLSRQRMQRLRESLAFRSLELRSSCVLEVPEGVLGVHGGEEVESWWQRGRSGDGSCGWADDVFSCVLVPPFIHLFPFLEERG
jgi:hypothetical protein